MRISTRLRVECLVAHRHESGVGVDPVLAPIDNANAGWRRDDPYVVAHAVGRVGHFQDAILSLAQEAGIKRWLLTHKHPHQLKAKYQAEFKAAQHKPAPVHAADREIERLRAELSKARDDRRHHEQLARAYALIINQLTEELEATKTERDALLDTPTIARLPRRLPI